MNGPIAVGSTLTTDPDVSPGRALQSSATVAEVEGLKADLEAANHPATEAGPVYYTGGKITTTPLHFPGQIQPATQSNVDHDASDVSGEPQQHAQQQPHGLNDTVYPSAIVIDPALAERAGNDDDDTDSALGDEFSSYSASLTSSVLSHQYEFGRRYHAYKDSSYIRPDDDAESSRLDFMHHIFTMLLDGKLYEAPIPSGIQNVLDVGCGTGLWAIEFGDQFPAADVLGVDINPIQPGFVPPNVHFEIDDVEEDFPEERSYDYVHCRYLAYAIKDWRRLINQIYNSTKPGGMVEFVDYDLEYRCDDGTLDNRVLKTWSEDLRRAGRMIGRESSPGAKSKAWLQEAGFTNVVEKVYSLPIGTWPADPKLKQIGGWNSVMLSQGAEGFTLRLFIKVLGWSHEEVQVLLATVRRELMDPRIHSYTRM